MGKNSTCMSAESKLEIKIHPCNRTQPRPLYQPKKWNPWLTPSIVIINIVFFMVLMYLNNCPRHSYMCIGTSTLGRFAFQSTHENPLLGPSSITLEKIGALDVSKVVKDHQVWRLASCMWLHAGVFHLAANMLSLLFVGIRLEEEFGFVRIGLLYVISGIGGSLLSSLFVRTTISVGASGALFGMLGAMLSELFINWTIYESKLHSLLILILIIVINLAVGILPHVDNFAHLGGFITGFLLGFVLLIRPQFGWVSPKNRLLGSKTPVPEFSKYKMYQFIMLLVSIVLLIIGFIVGLGLLLRGIDGNDHCSWCHYLRCVPTPLWKCDARCLSERYDNRVSLTCVQNHKKQFYILDRGNSTSHIQSLCVELCG